MVDADVVIPQWNQLFGPTIEALKILGGSGTILEIVDKVIEHERFSEDQLAVPHGDSSKSEIEYRLAWARTNLKNLGALENSVRGVLVLDRLRPDGHRTRVDRAGSGMAQGTRSIAGGTPQSAAA